MRTLPYDINNFCDVFPLEIITFPSLLCAPQKYSAHLLKSTYFTALGNPFFHWWTTKRLTSYKSSDLHIRGPHSEAPIAMADFYL